MVLIVFIPSQEALIIPEFNENFKTYATQKNLFQLHITIKQTLIYCLPLFFKQKSSVGLTCLGYAFIFFSILKLCITVWKKTIFNINF